jgi:hypothetical protein
LPDDFGLVDDQAGRHTIVSGHEAVAIGGTSMHGMTLAGFLELATSEPIGENRPLILGDRALDLQQKLIVGIVGDRMKQEDYLAPGPPSMGPCAHAPRAAEPDRHIFEPGVYTATISTSAS